MDLCAYNPKSQYTYIPELQIKISFQSNSNPHDPMHYKPTNHSHSSRSTTHHHIITGKKINRTKGLLSITPANQTRAASTSHSSIHTHLPPTRKKKCVSFTPSKDSRGCASGKCPSVRRRIMRLHKRAFRLVTIAHTYRARPYALPLYIFQETG